LLPNAVAKRPRTAEQDFQGVVVAQRGTTGCQVGDEVFGWVPASMSQVTSQGALSEYIRVRADHVAKKPKNISAVEAAGVATSALTAWQMLFKHAQIKEGDHIFVNGGTTSVGMWAIQIAKANGCRVTATTSGKNYEWLKETLHVDTVIDYTKIDSLSDNLAENPPEPLFNGIIDCVGTDNNLYTNSPAYLVPKGVVVSTGPDMTNFIGSVSQSIALAGHLVRPTWLGGTGRAFSVVLVENSRAELQNLAGLIEEGKINPVVDSVFKFDEVLQAYDRIMSKHTRGKVVIVLDDSSQTRSPPSSPIIPEALEHPQ